MKIKFDGYYAGHRLDFSIEIMDGEIGAVVREVRSVLLEGVLSGQPVRKGGHHKDRQPATARRRKGRAKVAGADVPAQHREPRLKGDSGGSARGGGRVPVERGRPEGVPSSHDIVAARNARLAKAGVRGTPAPQVHEPAEDEDDDDFGDDE